MQQIVVEVVGIKKTVTAAQLLDLVRKNYVSENATVTIDGVSCQVSDVYNQLINGASTITPPIGAGAPSRQSTFKTKDSSTKPHSAESPLLDILAQEKKIEEFPPLSTSPENPTPFRDKKEKSSRSKSRKSKHLLISVGVALLILISAFVFLGTQEAPDRQSRSNKNKQHETAENKVQEGKTNEYAETAVLDPVFDPEPSITSPQETEVRNNNSKPSTQRSQTQSRPKNDEEELYEQSNFYEAKNIFEVDWEKYDIPDILSESQDNTTSRTTESTPSLDVPDLPDIEFVKEPKKAEPLLVVDHDRIYSDFFSYNLLAGNIPKFVTIDSPEELDQALTQLGDKTRTIILKPSSIPYNLNNSTSIVGSVTIKGESGNPSDAIILVVPESTTQLGALEVSGGKLTLEGVTVKRDASCSEEYALVAVNTKGEACLNNCVLDATGAEGGRGVSVVGIGSSVKLEGVSFKGFADGVYAYSSSRMSVSNKCVFEENERGATVGDGAELIVSDSSFTRNKTGVQVKTDGTGSLTNSSFEDNDVPCVVDTYSERKFKRSNNKGFN